MRIGSKFTSEDITSEKMELKATAEVDDNLRQALTDEDAPLRSGLLPQVHCANAQGAKAVLAAITQVGLWTLHSRED